MTEPAIDDGHTEAAAEDRAVQDDHAQAECCASFRVSVAASPGLSVCSH